MFANRHVTAIVLARGGSKGLPGKNLRPLLGRPLVAWSLDHAKAVRCVDLIVLSTDDERIAAVGREAGARVILRPADLADDTARVDDALRHAVGELERAGSSECGMRNAEYGMGDSEFRVPHSEFRIPNRLDVLAVLYGNVPIRRPGLIDTAISMLVATGCDSVQSFASVGKCHPWWMYQMDHEGRVSFYDDHKVYRRQELPPLYVPDAAAIVVRRDVLMETAHQRSEPHAFFGADRRGVIQAPDATIDIDTELDLLVAEAMLRRAAR